MFAIILGGFLLIGTKEIPAVPMVALGYIIGLSVLVHIGVIQAYISHRVNPLLTLFLVVLLPSLYRLRKSDSLDCLKKHFHRYFCLRTVIIFGVSLVAFFVVYSIADAYTYIKHVDSMEYLSIGSLLNRNKFADNISMSQLENRMLALPIIHLPAICRGRLFLTMIGPFAGLSAIVVIYWMAVKGLKALTNDAKIARLGGVIAAIWLVSFNRFVMHVFYINTHLLLATIFMVLAGGNWLLALNSDIKDDFIAAINILLIPMVVVMRPEAALVLIMVLLPVVLSSLLTNKHKIIIILSYVIPLFAWQLFLTRFYINQGRSLPFSTLGMLFLGFVMLFSIPLLRSKITMQNSKTLLVVTESSLWIFLAVLSLRQPMLLVDSLDSMKYNFLLNSTGWGVSLITLSILVALTLMFTKPGKNIYLRFPVTTFIPLMMICAFLRESPYRIGGGDSLNRMIMHIVPLAVLFVISGIGTDWYFICNCSCFKKLNFTRSRQ